MSEATLDRIGRLSPAKQALLQEKLRQRAAAQGPPPIAATPLRATTNRFPCSFAQQQLWLVHQLEPESFAYNIPAFLRLSGNLDVAALERALSTVVRRHEVLRTTFEADPEPLQVVSPPAPVRLPVADLRALALEDREVEARRLARAALRRPFDLAHGPLLRINLVALEPEEHDLLLVMHHIVSDAWSSEILARELGLLYEGARSGRSSALPELAIQYADFSDWQRRWLSGAVLEAEIAHWRQRLDGLTQLLELPADRSHPPRPSARGAVATFVLSPGASTQLQAVARGQGATPFMVFLALFQLLLARSTGSDDVVVGSPVSGRSQAETHELIGCFVNMLALRTELRGALTFSALLERVREVTLAAFTHQDLPFEKLVSELQPERHLGRNPLFQTLLNVDPPAVEGGLRPVGLRLSRIEHGAVVAKFDLALHVTLAADGAFGVLTYAADLFEGTTAARLVRHFVSLAEQSAALPEADLAALLPLSGSELHQLLTEWNDTANGGAPEASIPERFAACARRSPDAVAVVYEEERLSFGALAALSGRIAARLRARDVGAEVRVPLLAERSLDLLIGLLAVLRAGGAYVPLDPELPRERLALLLADLGAPVLLTQRGLLPALPAAAIPSALLLEAEGEIPADDPPVVTAAPAPADAAYVIYTSGSTGRPKGVLVEHRQLASYLSATLPLLRLPAGASYALVSTVAADLGHTVIFGALCTGGTLHVIARRRLGDSAAMAEYFARHPVDCLKIVPSHLAALRAGLDGGHLLPGRALVLGGEALRWPFIAHLSAAAATCRILNEYGPTETTVGVATDLVDLGDAGRRPEVPMGRPLARTRLYVLDRKLAPVPIGALGELCVGGAQVARCYLGVPDLTAERFVPDPFSRAPGERLYRTGDRVRYLPDGRLGFLGRIDDQVKVRGFRVEPREIEEALRAHPGVREAVVLAATEEAREQEASGRLVAYVATGSGAAPAPAELRSFLKERLPDYMVPAAFAFLAALPLTANGKVDRRALAQIAPRIEQAEREAARAAPPLSQAEEVLVAIWKQVLRLQDVGVDDNFFGLGGDSILGIQVLALARKAGLRLHPRQIVEHPTVAGLAAVAERISAPAARPEPVAGRVPLTPIQEWFFARGLVKPEHYNLTVLLEKRPASDGARLAPRWLRRALLSLAAHHEALRIRFEPPAAERPSWRQFVEPAPRPVPLLEVDLAALPADRFRPALETAAARLQEGLDLARPPLLRAALFSAGEGAPDRLLLMAHHLIVDGVSWRILLEDLETAYRQLARGEGIALPHRTSSLRSWAESLVEHARSPSVQAQTAFWLDLLRQPVSPLPVDRSAGTDDVRSSRVVAVALDADETRALLQDVPRAYRTQINDALLTALVEAFAEWTGARRLLVDLEGHGRAELAHGLDTSRTVGWFTAVYPVLLDLEGITAPGPALKAVKERLRSIPDQGLGYGLARYLGGGEAAAPALGALPAAEVIFNYLGQLDQTVGEDRLFRGAAESAGPSRSSGQARSHLLEISAGVTGGCLRAAWIYSASRHLPPTIERLAASFVGALRRIIAHCRTAEAGYTPSDFPLARLDQEGLDRIAAAVPAGFEDLYPTSPVQQGMLFHTLQAPESGVYVVQLGLLLEADLDLAAFEDAWQQVMDRHAILRTAFVWPDGETPLQVVHARARPAWERHDWRGLAAPEQRARWAAFLAADRRRGFDVAAAPLLRLAMIRLGERRSRFLWSHHHVLLDGWSTSLLLREVFRLYEARRHGAPSRLPPPVPFREYIAWLAQQDMAAAEAFWRQNLAGFSAPTRLAVDRPARAGDGRRAVRQLTLTAAATEALRAFAGRAGLTLSTLMHGAWSALLGRYSGEPEVLFGTVTSGRSAPLPGIAEIFGIFINTLPMRVAIPVGERLAGWLQGIQERHAEARQFEYSSLVQIQGWSEIPRGSAMFESILAFDNFPVDEAAQRQAGRELGVTEIDASEQTHYKLSVVAAVGARWSLRVLFDAERFDVATVDRLLHQLEILLTAMRSGEQAVDSLPLLSAAERQQLREWNATEAEPAAGTLAELFEASSDARPELPAVVGADAPPLSYRAVEERANRLANLLRRLGAGPGELVAVQLERSPAMIEALLGIAKSGAAYLPLETTYPEARIRWLLERTRARAIVLGRATLELAARLAPELPHLQHLLCLEDGLLPTLPPGTRGWGPADLAAQPSHRPTRRVGPEDLAYIIFTSGSTGAPKGVMVRHRPAVQLIDWVNRRFAVGPGDRVLFVTSLCFDLSVYDVFGILAAGGTIRVAARGEVEDPRRLAQVLAVEPITFWDSAPAALQQLVPFLPEAAAAGGARHLRRVFLSGDWVPLSLPDQIRARFPAARVIALGGATEATVWSNFFPVAQVAPEWRSIPYGRPIDNARYYVLDGRLDPCPIGVPGDLYIAGGCLASGYAEAPELTADRFLPDPFGPAGAVMYRTGDRARFFADGNLEFLGRLDHQVKIRGFRIELGEIEAALGQHPAVAEALAIVREDRLGELLLTAYIVPRTGLSPSVAELRRHLELRLPGYMVPAAFVLLAAMPLTANGKVDRKALPAPAGRSGADFVEPQSPYEELLAGIFAEVLAVERVGREDSFFELGGHSLLAAQLVARLREAFGVEVALASLFEQPTVAELAVAVEQALAGEATATAPQLERLPDGEPLPLSFGQQRLWFLDQLEPGGSAYNIPSAFLLQGELDRVTFARAKDEIVRRHAVLRTVFAPVDGEPVQIVCPPRRHPVALVDLGSLPEKRRREETDRVAMAEAGRPFDLQQGPLLRVVLLRLGEQTHACVATMHHIVSDGWSQGLLLGELSALYEAFAAGEGAPLPELPVQYADFARWQRLLLSGPVLERELAYWRRQLGNLPPALDLTTDRPRPAEQSFRGAVVHVVLPQRLADGLRGLSRRFRATLFMMLLAAFKLLLSRLTGQPDILIGTPVAGREHKDLERLIGFFLNTLVLRTDLAGEPTFLELLARVRETALGAYSHSLIPFERLLVELQPERDLGRTPLFQVLFNMLNLPQPKARPSRLTLEPLPLPAAGAKFDLTVYAAESGPTILLNLLYNADLFERARLEALGDQLSHLLAQVVENPEAAIAEYSLVSPAARALLPDPAAALEEVGCSPVARLFLEVVFRQPQHPAVSRGERLWTYAELAAWALELGDRLAAQGLEKGRVVAVSGPRSLELIGSLLAVVLHGGVLLPLDPKLPAARQRAMLGQARATGLLYVGEPRAEDRWLWQVPGLTVLAVPSSAAAKSGAPERGERPFAPAAAELPPAPAPDDPAYIFFTSGTSGEPKGILGRQKSLGHFLTWQRETFGIGPEDRAAQLTGLSFDVVLRDIFLPLTSGSLLCLPEADDLDPELLLPWLEERGVTVLHTVPSLAGLWLGRVPAGVRLPALRWVFFAGEPLPGQLVERWREAFPETGGIVNLYGPTETTLAKCFYRVLDPPLPGVQPVGSALPQTQALVLGGAERLCGIGEPGEIVLRTPFRSLGYLAAPGGEPQRFRANPFRRDPEDILYFTGDRGRYRPDGTLEILGRLDDQLKVRGMRVEPAEIAAVLARHPRIRESAVLAREGAAGDRALVAYVVPRGAEPPAPTELRKSLAEQLPDYMIPALFVFLEALPLTPNGKLDRRALPASPVARPAGRPLGPPLEDRFEQGIFELWQELLPVPPQSVDDDFFALGGHSLLVLRLKAGIQERFGRSLPLAELFRAPTIATIAAVLRRETVGSPSPLVPLRQGGGPLPRLFCVHPAGGLVLGYQQLVEHLGPEVPFYGLQARGLETDEEPHTRIEEMARFYVEAMRTAQPEGPYHLAGWSFGGRVAFEMAQQLAATGERVALLALLDSAAPSGRVATPSLDLSDLLIHVAREAGMAVASDELRALAPPLQVKYLANLAVAAGLLPERAGAEAYLRRRTAVYRGNVVAAARYVPRMYQGPITLFRATEPWTEAPDDTVSPGSAGDDPTGGWERYSSTAIALYPVPGNHVTMMKEPHVRTLAALLRSALAASASSPTAGREAPFA
jgi:amino acid adenylation domain-containing protein/non-ribosomal peptide synthase protein (TIGR01720 family)